MKHSTASTRKRVAILIPQKPRCRSLLSTGIAIAFCLTVPFSEAFLTIRTNTANGGSSSVSCSQATCMGRLNLSFASVLFLRSIGAYDTATQWSRTRRMSVLLGMGKGDGKKKRKKKNASSSALSTSSTSSSSSSSSAAAGAAEAPLRVSNQINIPIRHQIRIAQLNKHASQQASTSFRQKPIRRTSYRRAWDEEEIESKAEERRRRGRDPDWAVILNRTSSAPLVIVDGYNIIHKWARLKKHMNKGDPQRARQMLVDNLEDLRSLKGWRIEVVFDGTKKPTIGPLGQAPGGGTKPTRVDQESKASVSKHGVRTIFTGVGVEADSYIEKRCAEAKNVTDGELTGSFIVATDDTLIRLAAQSAGAYCMGADRFVNELKAVKKGIEYRVEAAVAKVNGHAIRPEKLRKTPHTPRFGRRSVLIEDKRNRTKTSQDDIEEYEFDLEIEEVDGIPWWAQVPNHTNPYR